MKEEIKIIYGTDRIVRKQDFEVLDSAYEVGYRIFDTARIYGLGKSEKIIGEWIESRSIQNSVRIISKGSHPLIPYVSRLSRKHILGDIQKSLDSLKINCIDYYLLHRDDASMHVGVIIEALNEAVKNGAVKYIGVSNWTSKRIAEANQYARENHLIPFSVASQHFSLFEWKNKPFSGLVSLVGDHLQNERDMYLKERMPIFAYSPLGSGFISEKNLGLFERINNQRVYGLERNQKKLQEAKKIAQAKSATVAQIIISYLYGNKLDVIPIVRSQNIKRMRENYRAHKIVLTEREFELLEYSGNVECV